MRQSRLFLSIILLTLLVAPFTTSCSQNQHQNSDHSAMRDDFPMQVQNSNDYIRTAYAYAVEHPNDLEHIPCYCGCNVMGHMSNLNCYAKAFDEKGQPVYDLHAVNCAICLDITHDVMKMKDKGKSPLEIRQAIDAKYSDAGPGTDTALPLG